MTPFYRARLAAEAQAVLDRAHQQLCRCAALVREHLTDPDDLAELDRRIAAGPRGGLRELLLSWWQTGKVSPRVHL